MSKKEITKKFLKQHVRINKTIRDSYGEVWHEQGEIQRVEYISEGNNEYGKGLMFGSDLGIHYTDVELVEWVVFDKGNKPLAYKIENEKPIFINSEKAVLKLVEMMYLIKDVSVRTSEALNSLNEIYRDL